MAKKKTGKAPVVNNPIGINVESSINEKSVGHLVRIIETIPEESRTPDFGIAVMACVGKFAHNSHTSIHGCNVTMGADTDASTGFTVEGYAPERE